MQTKKRSIIESIANVIIGVGVAIASQYAIFPLFDIHVGLKGHLGITAWFTAISLIRSYLIRRYFTRSD